MTTHTSDAALGADVWEPFRANGAPFTGFGRAELLYALLAEVTPTALETAAKLGYSEEEINDNTRFVGGSSLFAQGLLVTDDGETFVPVHEAALVSRAATMLEAWLTFGAVAGEHSDLMLGLVVDDALLVIAPGPLDGFAVTMAQSGDDLLDVVGSMLSTRLENTDRGGIPVVLNHERPGEPSTTMFVRRHPTDPEHFEVALGEGSTNTPPVLPGMKSGDDVDEIIAGVLGVDPETGVRHSNLV